MGYAIHTLGLLDLTKGGVISGVDEELFWSIIDNTYVDDVSMIHTTTLGSKLTCSDNYVHDGWPNLTL